MSSRDFTGDSAEASQALPPPERHRDVPEGAYLEKSHYIIGININVLSHPLFWPLFHILQHMRHVRLHFSSTADATSSNEKSAMMYLRLVAGKYVQDEVVN